MKMPQGWWTTHPTLLALAVSGAWDSNGDGIGDLEGIRQHLDELVEMGFSGLWLLQVYPFGDDFEWHGLVAQDWYSIDPRYGSMRDFDRLMAECERRDIRVCLTAVPQYVGWNHGDYLAAEEAMREGTDDPRKEWFLWEDDGTVRTVWSRPAPNLANDSYVDAYLEYLGFWMDRGVAGWHADAVQSWMNLSGESLRRITHFVTSRGGSICSEYDVRRHDLVRQGGFNLGSGELRSRLYHEEEAMLERDTKHIRQGLADRDELIRLGMFPFQQFGNEIFDSYTGRNPPLKLRMFRLQVAFNASLPDQVIAFANGLSMPERYIGIDGEVTAKSSWGYLDHREIERQRERRGSPFTVVRTMLRLRADHPELGIGDICELDTNHRKPLFAALRSSLDGGKRSVVLFNFSPDSIAAVVTLPDDVAALQNLLSGERAIIEDGAVRVELAGFGFKLWQVIDL